MKSEARLFERLRRELPDEFIVLPCLEVHYNQAGRDSEADFAILHLRGRLGGQIQVRPLLLGH